MIQFNCIIHKETKTVIKHERWLENFKSKIDFRFTKMDLYEETVKTSRPYKPIELLTSDDFEIIYNSEFATDELKKIYNIFFNYSDSCENLEIKKKISNMINQRVEKPKHSPSRMMYEALKEAMEGKE